jgi:dolichol-phosphate mannosyltransferase
MPTVIKSLPSANKVKNTLVIAAFREFENLDELLRELDLLLPIDVSIIIADDTGVETEDRITEIVTKALGEERNWLITFENKKSGRGSAVLRGFLFASEVFSELEFYAECDADGSHQPVDIAKIILAPPCDFLIGSRYLKESRIEGWPLSRRVASKLLNSLIPIALELKSTDVTNGLRRYSRIATQIILSHSPKNTGFIFLSEQALLLSNHGIYPKEEPITFVNRIHGESSVGITEIVDSIKGVFTLYSDNRQRKK